MCLACLACELQSFFFNVLFVCVLFSKCSIFPNYDEPGFCFVFCPQSQPRSFPPLLQLSSCTNHPLANSPCLIFPREEHSWQDSFGLLSAVAAKTVSVFFCMLNLNLTACTQLHPNSSLSLDQCAVMDRHLIISHFISLGISFYILVQAKVIPSYLCSCGGLVLGELSDKEQLKNISWHVQEEMKRLFPRKSGVHICNQAWTQKLFTEAGKAGVPHRPTSRGTMQWGLVCFLNILSDFRNVLKTWWKHGRSCIKVWGPSWAGIAHIPMEPHAKWSRDGQHSKSLRWWSCSGNLWPNRPQSAVWRHYCWQVT